MNDTTSAPALEAAHDNHGPERDAGFAPLPTDDTHSDDGFEPEPQDDTETRPDAERRAGATTPLEQVTDWAELERRLNVSETNGEGDPETDGGEAEDGELPPERPASRPENPEEVVAARELPRNFRLHTQDPQRARFYQLLRQHPEANPADLARAAGYGVEPAAAEEAPGAENPKHDVEPRAALQETIADLAQRRRACREAYDFEQADALTEQLQAAQAELAQHEQTAARADGTQAEFVAAYEAARAEAAKGHPALAQEGSRQHRLARLLVAAKEQQSPEFFEDPGYPLRLVSELEREFPEAFPRYGNGREPRPAARSRPLGEAVAGATGGPRAVSRAQLERQIEQLSAEQLLALANKVGTPTGGWE